MLKKFLALGCVVALSAAFVGCEPAPVVDTPVGSDVTTPADEAVVVEDATGDAEAVVVEEPAGETN